jgi:hypothetical protein
MSKVAYMSAEQQCRSYVEQERKKAQRAAAERAVAEAMDKLSAQHGALVVLGALMRYVGLVLAEGGERPVVVQCRRYLTRKIVSAIVRGFLTRLPMLH